MTFSQAVEMLGTAPSLMALTYCSIRLDIMRPVTGLPLIIFVGHSANTFDLNSENCFTNSGRISPRRSEFKFCSCDSSSTGRTNVMHSRWRKSLAMASRILRAL